MKAAASTKKNVKKCPEKQEEMHREQGGKPREEAGRTEQFEVSSATESSVHAHPPRAPLPQQAWAVAHPKWYM